jgi:hypothetical protein
LVALLVLTPLAAIPSVKATPIINIDVDSQTLIAGAENTIVFTVFNSGDSTAQNVNATLTLPTNNMLLIDSDGSWNLSNIEAGKSTNITVRAYVLPSAAGSLIQLTVRTTYSYESDFADVTQTDSRSIGFSVATVDLSGAYLNSYFSTYDLNSSQKNNVSLIIENQGGRGATNISVSLGTPSNLGSALGGLGSLTSLTGSSSLSSSSNQFLLYNNTGRWIFDSLPANGSLELPLTIFVMPSAAGSISMFPVTLTYTDGFTYTQVTRYANVIVRGVVDIHVLETSTYPQNITVGKAFSATINIINLGTSTASGMLAFPQGNDSLTSASAESIFLGNVEVDVPTSITISYIASNITSGVYAITVPYTYKDSLGTWLNGTLNVQLKLTISSVNDTQSSDNQKGGILGFLSSYWWILVIVAVLVIVAIYLVMRSRKTRS